MSETIQERTIHRGQEPTTIVELHRLLLHAAHVHRARTAVAAEEDDQKT